MAVAVAGRGKSSRSILGVTMKDWLKIAASGRRSSTMIMSTFLAPGGAGTGGGAGGGGGSPPPEVHGPGETNAGAGCR